MHCVPGLPVKEKLFVPDLSEFGSCPVASHKGCAMSCQEGKSLHDGQDTVKTL